MRKLFAIKKGHFEVLMERLLGSPGVNGGIQVFYMGGQSAIRFNMSLGCDLKKGTNETVITQPSIIRFWPKR